MADGDPDETVFDVLGSEDARELLALAAEEPATAEELAEACGRSLPTVYRRLNALEDHGLLRTETHIDPDGNHYRTYETAVSRVALAIEEGEVSAVVERERDMVERFEAFWSDLERHTTEGSERGEE